MTEINDTQDVDMLQEHGVSAADILKLKAAGIVTVLGVQMTHRKFLVRVKGLSEAKVEKIKEASDKISPVGLFSTAKEYGIVRERVCAISTGSSQLDSLIGGGVKSMSVTEVYGEFRCGKTQLAHTLCVTCQLPQNLGGAEGKAVYIDTEGTFREQRIAAIADRFGMDPDTVTENILVARAYNSEHQLELINKLSEYFAVDRSFRLLVIDSIMALFRVEYDNLLNFKLCYELLILTSIYLFFSYCGRGELSERQQKLNVMLARLTRLAEEFNLCVFLTNQVQADPGASLMFASAERKPVGGE